MQARYYDPVIGRFYSNDPKGFSGVYNFNRYAYAANNPYKYTDPDGRDILGLGNFNQGLRDGQALVNGSMTVGQLQERASNEGVMLLTAASIALPGPEELVLAGALTKMSRGAESAINGVKLEKQLASESQLTELAEGGGKVLSQPAKQANRIAEQHGVDPANVQKVSSSAHTAKDGSQVQTHAFRDASTNKVIEPKSIIDETQ